MELQFSLRHRPLAAFLLAGLLAAASPLSASQVELVSQADPSLIADTGNSSSLTSIDPQRSVSADGRYVAFVSTATNLVAGQTDDNAISSGEDVFLFDRVAGTVTLVSHSASSATATGNKKSDQPVISADGSYIAFRSKADDLIAGQVNSISHEDVFLFQRTTGTITLVSHSATSASRTGSDPSGYPVISDDGRYVAFSSQARDLVPGLSGDYYLWYNVFLFDRVTGTTTLVSHDSSSPTVAGYGLSGNPMISGDNAMISGDGRWIAYSSDANDLVTGQTVPGRNIFLFDRTTGANVLVSHSTAAETAGCNQFTMAQQISTDGRWITFISYATDLIAGFTGSSKPQVFLYDRDTRTNLLVSHAAGSATTASNEASEEAKIGSDGTWIAFRSSANDLVAGQTDAGPDSDVFLYERTTGTVTLVSHAAGAPTTAGNGKAEALSLSSDGRWVAFTSRATDLVAGITDANAAGDLFLFDRTSGTIALVSRKAGLLFTGNGSSGNPVISADGDWIAFTSEASNLAAGQIDTNGFSDVYLHDRTAVTNTAASLRTTDLPSLTAGGMSDIAVVSPLVSSNGRWVAFISQASNLVAGQVDDNNGYDVFLRDRMTGMTTLVSRSATSPTSTGNRISREAAVSDDGRWVIFSSAATDLVAGQTDTNNATDVFLFERETGAVTLISRSAASPAQTGNNVSFAPTITQDGARIAFLSYATNLVAGETDSNSGGDVFLYDRTAGTVTLVSHAAGSATAAADGGSGNFVFSAEGRFICFLSTAKNLVAGQIDPKNHDDLFLQDLEEGGTVLASRISGTVASSGNGAVWGFAVSGDGRWAVFNSDASNLVAGQVDNIGSRDTFLFDRDSGAVALISHAVGSPAQATGSTGEVAISGDGRSIVFTSSATNLVPGQSDPSSTADVFLHDRTTGETVLVSHVPNTPTVAGNGSSYPVVSADDHTVAYSSHSTTLVAGAGPYPPGAVVIVYDRSTGTNKLASRSVGSAIRPGNDISRNPVVSADGSAIVFTSSASDLVAGDRNQQSDVFVYRNGARGHFYTLTPCRLFDSRRPGDDPALVSGNPVILALHGACGIPETAKSIAINVTVTAASGAGHLTLHAGNLPTPPASTINFGAGQTRANNAVVPLASDGSGTLAITPVVLGNGTVHVIVDVTGYFE